MTIRASLMYSLRLVFSKNRTSARKSMFGAMICIGVSLVPLITVLSVSGGMIEEITGRIIGLSTQDVTMFLEKDSSEADSEKTISLTSDLLCNVEHVTGGYPEVQGSVLASSLSGDKIVRSGATLRAVRDDMFSTNESFAKLFKIVEGNASFDGKQSAVLCQKIASDIGVHTGDKISVITADVRNGKRIVPKNMVLTVSGIISCGYQELDALWIFIPLETGFDFIPAKNAQYSIGLTTDETFTSVLYKVKSDVMELCEDSYVLTWSEQNKSQFENFSSTRVLLLLIMILILLVASVNISSALVMLVMEHRKEIAILKSIGGSGRGITLSFLIAGILCGAGGLVIGFPMGITASLNINVLIAALEKFINFTAGGFYHVFNQKSDIPYVSIKILDPAFYLQEIKPSLTVLGLFGVAVLTLVLSALASLLPSVRAGGEKPLDLLQKN